jgi:hypothetical protein
MVSVIFRTFFRGLSVVFFNLLFVDEVFTGDVVLGGVNLSAFPATGT